MPLYPARALERAMKIKEVITRAMSGQINWLQAAEMWQRTWMPDSLSQKYNRRH